MMTEELFEHLSQQFYWNNHTKYIKYFDEWVNNLTPTQI